MQVLRSCQLVTALTLSCLFQAPCLARQIKITPAAPTVGAGGKISISADRPVTFSLSGYGSMVAENASSATYSAPASGLYPQHLLAGCMVGPNDSVFNVDISKLPVDSKSAAWTPFILSGGLELGFKWGLNIVNNATPMAAQEFQSTTQLNGTLFPAPPQTSWKRQNGAFTTDEELDHHMISLNTQTCQFYETNQQSVGLSQCSSCTAESGWRYSAESYALPSGPSADLSGLPLAPLTVHLSEFYASHISHALRFTACTACVGPGARWPATNSVGSQSGGPPAGTRFRLKSSFNISSFPTAAQRVLTALQHYGMILAGTGPDTEISFATDVTEDAKTFQALQSLSGGALNSSNFEVVDESSYLLSPASTAVNPRNGFEDAVSFAVLTITDAAKASNVVHVPIALQAAMAGTPEPRIVVQAGTPSFQIPSWVTGSANQAITWTLNPATGYGAISASGVYTPPASVNTPQSVTATLVSSANTIPFATANVEITVIPSGQIRIDTGSEVPSNDQRGLAWMYDVGFETGNYSSVTELGGWSGTYNPAIWRSYMQTEGDDILYTFRVPNGTYAVQMMFGVGNCSGSFASQSPGKGLIWGPLSLQAQSTLAHANWNFASPIRSECQTPETGSMTAQVVDNVLTVAVRASGGNNEHTAALLNGLIITPVGSTAVSDPAFEQISSPGVTPSYNIQEIDPACGQSGYNCRPAFQKAFGMFAQTGGGTLTLPAGTFLVDFPELAQNVVTAPWFSAASLLAVPPNTTIQGTPGASGSFASTIQWRSTSMPVFVFDKASHSSMQNLHLSFTGTTATSFPYGDVMLLDVLGYDTAYPHENEMMGSNAEMFSFALVFDSDYVTFHNLLFDSTHHANGNVFGTAINLKGKGVIVDGNGGLTTLAVNNEITDVQLDDFLCGLLVAGQSGAKIQDITADRRGSTGQGAPGHLLYVTDTFQGTPAGIGTGDLENTNLTIDGITEGPDTYSNANAGGTLAIKSVSGGSVSNVSSEHPEGLLQTLYEDQNITFSNMTWKSSYNLCMYVPGNCITPIIYSTEDSAQFSGLKNLTFNNISLTSTAVPITALLMGDNVTVNGFKITTPPVFLPGQTLRSGVLSVKETGGASISNYVYTPLITSYKASQNYNVPFMAWHPSSNVHASLTVVWPSAIPVPTGAPIITSGIQDGNENNSVKTSIQLE